MSAIAIGLLLGAGVFCLYWSTWPRAERPTRAGRTSLADRVRDQLVQAGFDTVSPGQLLAACLVVFVIVFLGAFSMTRVVPIAICFAAMASYGPRALVAMRARKRRGQLRELWPDAVDNIASAVRAGLALPEALSQLAVRGPEELRPAFAAFAEDYRTTGRFHDCLNRLKDRLADPVADRLVESLRIAREVGGSDLGRVLRTLSAFLREDARTRAELGLIYETRRAGPDLRFPAAEHRVRVRSSRLNRAEIPWRVLALRDPEVRPPALDGVVVSVP